MKPIFKLFYREKGIRYVDRLLNPPLIKFDSFPRSSLFHYVPSDIDHPEADVSQTYFQGYSKKINFDYITEYSQQEGAVRKPPFNLNEATRAFKRENLQKWQYGPELWRTDHNPETLHVLNYGYLDVIYKYLPVQFAEYHRWLNRQRTVWAKVAEIAKVSEREQFIFVPMPALLQGRAILDKFAEEEASLRMVQIFGQQGYAGYMQLDLWRWLNPKLRQKSLMGVIEPKDFSKVNLVFFGTSGNQAIVNLGYLNSWIKGQPNTTEFSSVVQFDPVQIQKMTLKTAMTLNAVLSEELPEQSTAAPSSAIAPKIKEEPNDLSVDQKSKDDEVLFDDEKDTKLELSSLEDEPATSTEIEGDRSPESSISKQTTASANKPALDDENRFNKPELSKLLLIDLEKDMEALDHISLKQIQVSGIKVNSAVEEDEEPEITPEEAQQATYQYTAPSDVLRKWLDTDAEANLLTAADYRKLKEAADAYQNSEDPYGSSKPRMEAMQIVQEDLEIKKEDIAITVSDTVPDPTMAESTLVKFDKQYLKKVYKKDILQAVNSIQSAGVIVRRHEIDVTHSALGSYEHHTLELKPVDGAPSVLKFTFPKVNEDGTFMAGTNIYRLRTQRVDVPIRKIGPQTVALSSYYGKTFVQTNPKVSNSSLTWLCRQINLAAFDQENYITEVNPSNVFDNDFKAPYIYNALAQEYGTLRTETLQLNFDRKHRLTINPETLKALEKNGRVFCGMTNKNDFVVVDRKNDFYSVSKQGEELLGNIYDVLKLDTAKCPIDFAEVRVYSKYIPIGIVLAYYLGFSKLIALLKAPYRVIEGRKQKNLEKDEFAITFKDESYIFKTTDKIASMILYGFNDYEKNIKLYDRKAFEHKDVYLNLLMSKGMAAIYIRELDMMENCFVDPITKEILEDMKQPVTFKGLLVRACEMLTTYHHPVSQDRSAMRDRGYERFAGALYKELMTATRQFRNKNLVGRSKIDMSPYQVWNAIMKDSSLKIVEDTNPIQNLKESEVITFSGTGGRDQDTMTKPTRAYHKNDVGILSESTVDSTGVGTIAYLSANPNIKNVRGLAKDEKVLNPTSMLSTSALLSPASMNDN